MPQKIKTLHAPPFLSYPTSSLPPLFFSYLSFSPLYPAPSPQKAILTAIQLSDLSLSFTHRTKDIVGGSNVTASGIQDLIPVSLRFKIDQANLLECEPGVGRGNLNRD
jgi:hypothetical protein